MPSLNKCKYCGGLPRATRRISDQCFVRVEMKCSNRKCNNHRLISYAIEDTGKTKQHMIKGWNKLNAKSK